MGVHALRVEVGDRDFFRILRAWTSRRGGGNGTIPQFIRLAERISGQQLDDLFQTWLFTGSRPVLEGAAAASAARAKAATAAGSAAASLRARRREGAGLRADVAGQEPGSGPPGRSRSAAWRTASATLRARVSGRLAS